MKKESMSMNFSIKQLREMVRTGYEILDYEFIANVRDTEDNLRYSERTEILDVLEVFTHAHEEDYTVDLKVIGLSEIGQIRLLTFMDELLKDDGKGGSDLKSLEEAIKSISTLTVYSKPHVRSQRIAKAPFWIVDRVNEKLGDAIIMNESFDGTYFISDNVLLNVESACKEMGYNFRIIDGWAE